MSDILIVGGGAIGLLTARELVRSGAEVTLVEREATGREASWAGGGILSPLYPWCSAPAVTALSLWSQRQYPRLCTELREESGIDCEHTVGGLLVLEPDEPDRARSWGRQHQVRIESVPGDRLHTLVLGLGPRCEVACWLPEIARIRNPRLLKALRRSLVGRVSIREQEEVLALVVDSGRAVGVRTRRGVLAADRVLVCAGAWTGKLFEPLGSRPAIEPVRGQMLLFRAAPGQLAPVVLFRDRYLIPRQDGRILIGSTLERTGFVKATTIEAEKDLYRAAVELLPLLASVPVEHHWAGLRPGAPEGIPYIGVYPGIRGLYCNAGHYRNGLVTGLASARLAADLLLGRPPILDPAPYAFEADRTG